MTSTGQPCPCPPPLHSHQREAGNIPSKVTGQQVAVLRPALPSHPTSPHQTPTVKPQVSWAIRNLPVEAWSFSFLSFLGLFSRFSNSRLLQKPRGACTGTFFCLGLSFPICKAEALQADVHELDPRCLRSWISSSPGGASVSIFGP